MTSYSYDALKRVTIMTRQANTNITQYTYDAEGRRLSETLTAGAISLTSSNQYDLAGRLIKSWDTAGRLTERAYTDSGRTVTETLPGGLTRVTSRFLDGKTKSITGTAQIAQYYEYGVTAGLQWTKVYTGSDSSPVWTKSYADALGRTVKTEKPGFSGTQVTESFYNNLGQLIKTTTTGQPATLYTYDELGNQFRSGQDINANDALDLSGIDRISESESAFVLISSTWWQQAVQKIYAIDNSATPITNSVSRQQLSGLPSGTRSVASSLDSFGNETISIVTLDRAAKKVTQTTDFPDSTSNAVSITVDGLVQSQSGKSGNTTTFGYDALGRRIAVTDPRTGTAMTHYDSQGQVDWVEDAAGNTTTFTYDPDTGRRLSQTDPLTNTTYMSYTAHGQLEKTWGSATYPVSYAFDAYGRMTNMCTYRDGTGWSGSTWPASAGTADKTTWTYHEASGLLTAKTDNAGKSVTYTYASCCGKLATRTWSRVNGTNNLTTTYSYSSAGDLIGIDYSDSTPDVSFTYDRLGRQITADSSVSAHTFSYQMLNLQSEIVVRDGVTNTITKNYDGFGRATGFTLGADYSVQYSYDTYGRFSSVSSSVPSCSAAADFVANYSYLQNSDLLSGYSDSASGLQVTRTYENHRNLLTQINNSVDSTTLSEYNYANDAGGRRTSVKHSGTAFDVGPAFNAYGYNARSEVTNAARYWGADLGDTSEPVDGQAYGYDYDNIGNRKVSNRGFKAMTYTANGLNQYTQRTIPDGIDVLGSAETNTTVTVNNLATTRFAKYWFRALTVTNTSVPVYQAINIVGVYNPPGTNDPDVVTTAAGHAFVARTPEAFTYDDDGNLLSDGRFAYTWDAENRLIGAETSSNLVGTAVPAVRLEFAYDYMSRRTAKTVYSGLTNNYYQITNNAAFLYDGWNLISEICNLPSEITTNCYVWGLDLSGSLSGAGGIGGLLAATIGTNSVCYTYDGNGNVSELINPQSTISNPQFLFAHYEYSAFGETIVATGPFAKENKFRFSTKPVDDVTGLVLYEFRPYYTSLGRWLSRDPLGENAGVLLVGFVQNCPVCRHDSLGLIFGVDIPGVTWDDYNAVVTLINSLVDQLGDLKGLPTPKAPLNNNEQADWSKMMVDWFFEEGANPITFDATSVHSKDIAHSTSIKEVMAKWCKDKQTPTGWGFTGMGADQGNFGGVEWFLGSYSMHSFKLAGMHASFQVQNVSGWYSGTRLPQSWQDWIKNKTGYEIDALVTDAERGEVLKTKLLERLPWVGQIPLSGSLLNRLPSYGGNWKQIYNVEMDDWCCPQD